MICPRGWRDDGEGCVKQLKGDTLSSSSFAAFSLLTPIETLDARTVGERRLTAEDQSTKGRARPRSGSGSGIGFGIGIDVGTWSSYGSNQSRSSFTSAIAQYHGGAAFGHRPG